MRKAGLIKDPANLLLKRVDLAGLVWIYFPL